MLEALEGRLEGMPVVLDAIEITGDDGDHDGAEDDDAEDDQGAGCHAVVQKPNDGQPPEAELRGTAKLVGLRPGPCKVTLLLDGGLDRELVRDGTGDARRADREGGNLRHQYRILGSAMA